MRPAASAPGRRIYRDPVTGRIGAPPPGVAVERPRASLATSSDDLVETPGPTPAHGVTVHLQGRFRSTMSATRDAAGNTSTRCQVSGAPPQD